MTTISEVIIGERERFKMTVLVFLLVMETARAEKRKNSKATGTTEKPKKLVIRMLNQPMKRAVEMMWVWFFLHQIMVQMMRRRYEPRPRNPVVAKKLRYSL